MLPTLALNFMSIRKFFGLSRIKRSASIVVTAVAVSTMVFTAMSRFRVTADSALRHCALDDLWQAVESPSNARRIEVESLL